MTGSILVPEDLWHTCQSEKRKIFMLIFFFFFSFPFPTRFADALKVCEDHKPDLLLLPTLAAYSGLGGISEILGNIPWAVVHTVPGIPTGDFAPPTAGVGQHVLFGMGNRALW